MIAAHRQHRGMPDIPIDIDGDIGGAAAHIAHDHAHLALGLSEHHFGRGQRVEHELRNIHTGRAQALAQVLDGGLRRR